MIDEQKRDPFREQITDLQGFLFQLENLENTAKMVNLGVDALRSKIGKLAEKLSWEVKMAGKKVTDYDLPALYIPFHVATRIRIAVSPNLVSSNKMSIWGDLQFFEQDKIIRDTLSSKLGYVVESSKESLSREQDWENPYFYREFSEAEVSMLANEVFDDLVKTTNESGIII